MIPFPPTVGFASEIEEAFFSTNPADSANLRVGDLLMLSQIRLNPEFGENPALLPGFASMHSGGYSTGSQAVSGRISAITVTPAQIGASFAEFQSLRCIRARNRKLSLLSTVRTTTGDYDASGLPSPLGFAYTVNRGNSFAPGSVGSISGLAVDGAGVYGFANGSAAFSIRIGLWFGAAPPGTYTMTLGSAPPETYGRHFHVLSAA